MSSSSRNNAKLLIAEKCRSIIYAVEWSKMYDAKLKRLTDPKRITAHLILVCVGSVRYDGRASCIRAGQAFERGAYIQSARDSQA